MKWFTSDEHYGHRNIIKFCKRPFANIDDMREALIANHNARVSKTDETYHLGDMFWNTLLMDECLNTLKRLNGRHYLIRGNHDERAEQMMGAGFLDHCKRFEWLKDVYMFRENGVKIWLSHYAHRVYPSSHKNAYHLYGHTHDVLPDFRLSMDVGVDASLGRFAPWSLEQIDNIMKMRLLRLPKDEVQRDMDKNKWGKNDE